MSKAIEFRIEAREGMWRLSRDGQELHSFSHADRAVHEAVVLARELDQTGQPAQVLLAAADGRLIEVDITPEPPAEEPEGGDRSAIDPGR